MARPKGSKNKEAQVVETAVEPVAEAPKPEPVVGEAKEAPKKAEKVLIKTGDRDVVAAANKLKYEVKHISGYGSVHSPKVFFLVVDMEKLAEEVPERMENVELADASEIALLVKASKERGAKEYAESGAQKRKLNSEIKPSEFYDA
jgi:hypothetical protein